MKRRSRFCYALFLFLGSLAPVVSVCQDIPNDFILYRQSGEFKVNRGQTFHPAPVAIGAIAGRQVVELKSPVATSNMGKVLTVDQRGYVWYLETTEDKEIRIDPRTFEMTEYQLPHGAAPYSLSIDSRGAHWITAHGIEVLLESYPEEGRVIAHLPPSHGFLIHINVDRRDDTVWFSMPSVNKLVNFHRERGFKEYELPTASAGPGHMDFDSRGNVWIPELYTGKLAKLDPQSGQFQEFELPTPRGLPVFCMVATRDDIWVSEPMADKYARFRNGVFREFDIPTRNSVVSTSLEDADGKIWITEGGWRGSSGGNRIARLDPETGHVEELALPTRNAQPVGITLDPSGNIWFQERSGGKIARILASQRQQATAARQQAAPVAPRQEK